jgi:DNA-directed RNA polymerase subunit N (RpoN/RPB10)
MGSDKGKLSIVRTPESKCFSCGVVIDTASSPFNNKLNPAKKLCITICLKCGHIMAYQRDFTLRELTNEEIILVAGDDKILRIQEARGKVIREVYNGKTNHPLHED